MKLTNHLKITLRDFFQFYPAWGFSLCSLILLALTPSLRLICLLFFKFNCLRKFLVVGYIFVCISTLLPRPFSTVSFSTPLEGLFIPLQRQTIPQFSKNQVLVKGLFKTPKGLFWLELPDRHFIGAEGRHAIILIEKDTSYDKTAIVVKSLIFTKKTSYLFRIREKVIFKIKAFLISTKYQKASELLIALFTGHLENKLLKAQFSYHGIAHILALSGFHLNLLMTSLLSVLSKLSKRRGAVFLGLCFLLTYVILIGRQSALIRAFFMALHSNIQKERALLSFPIQSFGVSLFFTSFLCVDQIYEAGFILTFIATLSLILYSIAWNRWIKNLVDVQTVWEKFIVKWLKLFLLQIFVSIFTLPVVLYFFGFFSMSFIFFNLIYPTMISLFMYIGLFFILVKCLFYQLGNWLLEFLYSEIETLLKGIEKPLSLSFNIHFQIQSPFGLSCYLLLVLLLVFLICAKKIRCSKSIFH